MASKTQASEALGARQNLFRLVLALKRIVINFIQSENGKDNIYYKLNGRAGVDKNRSVEVYQIVVKQ